MRPNARINAAGINYGTAKLSIKVELLPLALNELLGAALQVSGR
jgi:hypothetical protein